MVGKFVQKSQTGWNLQYTPDERYCARVVTNEVHFYESGDLGTVWNRLRVEGVVDFALSPGKNHSVAVFIPERKVMSDGHTSLRGFKVNIVRLPRANQPQSRCSISHSFPPLCLKRLFTRVIK